MNAKSVAQLGEVIRAAMSQRETAAGIAVAVDAAVVAPLRERIERLEGETAGHVRYAASLLVRLREEAHTRWDVELPPGGEVCATCGQPVESEPCPEHNPRALAAALAAEVERLRVRTTELFLAEYGDDHTSLHATLDAARKRVDEWAAPYAEGRGYEWEEDEDGVHVQVWTDPDTDRPLHRTPGSVLPLTVQGVGVGTGLALPWAAAMADEDLHLFLNDLLSAAMGRWRQDPEVPDRVTLADIEKACSAWRTPGEGLRAEDEPVPYVLTETAAEGGGC